MESIFEIKDLVCSYDGSSKNAVLEIPYLEIPKGEIVFLLGASGSGKSTLLEALGLMNNTIASGDIRLNLDNDVSKGYSALWQTEGTSELAEVRRSSLSFIFQNTNLMDNFSVYENICLSSMIQKNVQQSQALDQAKVLMEKIGLPETEVPTGTLAKNLSGGQRQRVAFARALNPGPKVLFGDEPTGNLDEKNADELLKIIRTNLGKESSAIIVSHDIRLALKHADRIICFSKTGNGKPSVIRESDIYERSVWNHLSPLETGEFVDKLKGYYQVNLETSVKVSFEKPDEDTSIGYRSLFLRKEGKALLGTAYSNLLRLIGILAITMLAIGFANGSLNYLDVKLNDPFVNWLTIKIPSSKSSEMYDIMTQLNSPDVKAEYHIASVVSYTEAPLFFFNKKQTSKQFVNGRSIKVSESLSDPMLADILAGDNLIRGEEKQGFRGEKDLSVIVTSRFMERFGYDLDDPIIYLDLEVENELTGKDKALAVPIGVRAVVKEMPGKADVAYGEFFLQAHNQIIGSPFDLRHKKDLKLLVFADSLVANSVLKATKDFLRQAHKYGKYSPEATNYNKNNDTYLQAYEIQITFWPSPDDTKVMDQIYDELLESQLMQEFATNIQRYYNYHDYDGRIATRINYDMLSANFTDLDKVRLFSEFIWDNYNEPSDVIFGSVIEADLAKVREKENFNFLSTIAYIISVLVVLFGVTSVSMFVSNLLRNHLSKIQMNLGTFKAFGLGDQQTQSIYFIIILRFMSVGLIAAAILAFGMGKFIELIMAQFFKIEDSVHYFKLLDLNTLYAIGFVVVIGVIASWITINKMLNKTPGDLIYNR